MKNILTLIGLLILTFAFSIFTMLIGMSIGGNYFVNFEFMGGRGYEAMGILFFLIGIFIGLCFSTWIMLRNYKANKKAS